MLPVSAVRKGCDNKEIRLLAKGLIFSVCGVEREKKSLGLARMVFAVVIALFAGREKGRLGKVASAVPESQHRARDGDN